MATTISNPPSAEGTNSWTDPSYARNDDGTQLATCQPAKNSSVAGIWTNFGFTDPGGTTNITQVRLGVQAKESVDNTRCSVSGEVSWDGGTSWSGDTTIISTSDLTTTSLATTFWIDVTAATTWTWTKLNNSNLQARIYGKKGSTTTTYTISMDVLFVEVTYTTVVDNVVTETVTVAEVFIRGKDLVATDSVGAADSKIRDVSATVTDSAGVGGRITLPRS